MKLRKLLPQSRKNPKKQSICETQVNYCHFCSKYFCDEHLHAKKPSTPIFNASTKDDLLAHDEWAKAGGHPCPESIYFNNRQEELNKEREFNALNKMLAYSPSAYSSNNAKYRHFQEEHNSDYGYSARERRRTDKPVFSSTFRLLFLVAIGLAFLGYLASELNKNSEVLDKPTLSIPVVAFRNCSIMTAHEECSKAQKPRYCVNGTFINRADLCGCNVGYRIIGTECKKILKCSDGTEYGKCALLQPKYCENGKIIENANICGCQFGQNNYDGVCLSSTSSVYEIYLATNHKLDVSDLELTVHDMINTERQASGLNKLTFDSSLSQIAREHSEDMVQRSFFDHVNPDGLDPTARGVDVGYSCYKNYGSYYTDGLAENIAQNSLHSSTTYIGGLSGMPIYAWKTTNEIAISTVNGWMLSPGHRKNILTSTYDAEGIGVAVAQDGNVFVTQDFC